MSLLDGFRTEKKKAANADANARNQYVEIIGRADNPSRGDDERLVGLAERLGYATADVERDVAAAIRINEANAKLDTAKNSLASVDASLTAGRKLLADLQRDVKKATADVASLDDKLLGEVGRRYARAAAAGVALVKHMKGDPYGTNFLKAHGWSYFGHNPLAPSEGLYGMVQGSRLDPNYRPMLEKEAIKFLAATEVGPVESQVMAVLQRASTVGEWERVVDELI